MTPPLPAQTTTVSLIDLTEYLDAEGLEITRPIYYKWIAGIKTPVLTVAKKKNLAGPLHYQPSTPPGLIQYDPDEGNDEL